MGTSSWGVVQLAERQILNLDVMSSTLISPSIIRVSFNGRTLGFEPGYRGSNPLARTICPRSSVVEHRTCNAAVVDSIPTGGSIGSLAIMVIAAGC
jgi:hypothetical protein